MQTKQSVIILQADSNGCYPIPAVKGGAVSTLMEHLVRLNDDKQTIDLSIVSFFDEEAERQANSKYPNINFIWVRRSWIVKSFDWLILHIVKLLLPKQKWISYIAIASLLWYIWKAKKILKETKYDKVVLQNNIPLIWAIKLSKYKGDYIYHLHNIPRINAKCKELFSKCKRFLCVSEYVGKAISNIDNPIGPIPEDKIRVLYNCVDTRLFRPKEINKQDLCKQFGIFDNEHIIMFSGRLSQEKGVDYLLKSLDFIKTPNIKVLIVGSAMYNQKTKDAYHQQLLQLAKKHKEKIVFTGYIPQQTLPDIYNLADISVLPSIWDEPAGLTMIESLACGTPVITTNSGGIPEYVAECAIVLERNSCLPKEIAKAIDMLFSDEILYKKYKQIGFERIQKYFSSDNYLDSFIKAIL
ncbi:MAG: glycosyltransferase family 4 protein [Bacteroidales bacterium]|nr:glycosyltransferase family 4 protein [Bacteroidales bacterium]